MATPSDHLLQCPPPRPMTVVDRRWRANIDPAPNCPRCASPNTKFCYYNNYSLSQPRFFCKGCRRYWTRGGSLRNVPVGGGCRKSRRSRSSRNLSHGSSGVLSSHSSCHPSPNSSSSSQESGGPDIDMAAVFAKFLSHDKGDANEEINEATNTPSEASDSLTSSSCGFENVFDSQKLSDDVFDQELQAMEGIPPCDHTQLQEEEAMQGYISPDLASFDDIIEDVFWSDTSNLSSLTWQPAAQSQEFDSPLLPVDHSKISTNMFSSDNWSYFDTTGFEVFSRT